MVLSSALPSNTAPVREMIEHDNNGLLVDFFDIEGMASLASRIIDSPHDYKHLGRAGA